MFERVASNRNQDYGLREGKGKSAERGAMGVVDLPSEKFFPETTSDPGREGRYVSYKNSLKLKRGDKVSVSRELLVQWVENAFQFYNE